MEQLLKMLNGWFPMSPELQVALMHRIKKEVHRKNKYILRVGEVCDWVAFIETGICKVSFEPDNGIERVIGFFREGDMVGSMKSFYEYSPSRISIRTIEETHLRKIPKIELEAIYEKYLEFNIAGRKITEHYFSSFEDHLLFMALSPKQRYLLLEKSHPRLFTDGRIKDYLLAAFIGIDKATLSRNRKRLEKVDHDQQLSFID